MEDFASLLRATECHNGTLRLALVSLAMASALSIPHIVVSLAQLAACAGAVRKRKVFSTSKLAPAVSVAGAVSAASTVGGSGAIVSEGTLTGNQATNSGGGGIYNDGSGNGSSTPRSGSSADATPLHRVLSKRTWINRRCTRLLRE